MIRVLVFLAAILAAAVGLSWLADNPGTVNIEWPVLNLKAEPSVFQVVIGLALLVTTALASWSLFRNIWNSPAAVGNVMNRRRQQRGLDALSSGMIAIGAGDRDTATRYAIQARKSLPNEPLTHLLRAQAAQLSGDKATSRRIFEAMLAAPDTEQLGLRGLFVEAQRENEPVAAKQFAERALHLNQKLAWASDALFDIQCKAADWDGALETLAIARRNSHIEKGLADRRRAVLLTSLALNAEDGDPARALALAAEAHGLAPDLVPAANLAGRMLAARGNTAKAAKILQKTWTRCPHPDLATAYAFARIGDSPRDRLERVKQLAALNPHSPESAIAVANAAIDAKEFNEARSALEPMLEGNLTQRIATLMARIESEQHGDKGRVREWLARAVNAPRDPVWTADNVISETWAPVSPVTGQLDAFQWRVPVESVGTSDTALVARKIEELVALGAPVVRPTEGEAAAVGADAPPKPASTAPVKPTPQRAADVTDAIVVDEVKAEIKLQPKTIATVPVQPKPAAVAAALEPVAKPAAQPIKPVAAAAQTVQAKPAVVASQPVPAPVKTAAKSADKSTDAASKEARIFVVPHAPDDPGLDAGDADGTVKPRPPYRVMP